MYCRHALQAPQGQYRICRVGETYKYIPDGMGIWLTWRTGSVCVKEIIRHPTYLLPVNITQGISDRANLRHCCLCLVELRTWNNGIVQLSAFLRNPTLPPPPLLWKKIKLFESRGTLKVLRISKASGQPFYRNVVVFEGRNTKHTGTNHQRPKSQLCV